MSTVTRLGEDDGEYGQHSLRFDHRAGRGMAEGHIGHGTFCLGFIDVPFLSGEVREEAFLLTVSSDSDPDHCIEIILNEEDFTRVVQKAFRDRLARRYQLALRNERPQ